MWDRSRRRALLTPALLALILVALVLRAERSPHATAVPTGAGLSGKPAPAGLQLGASVNRLFNDADHTQRQITAQLEALRATGATVARSDALWEASEPGAPVRGVHRYDWRFDDQIAGSLAAAGLQWLPIVDYSAPWAQSIPGQDHSRPTSPTGYAAYAGALAARYGTAGSFWRAHPALTPHPVQTYEIWNEPDSASFWEPAPSAASYAALYQLARDAITAVDPSARVIVGGLTQPARFLPAMLAARPSLRGHVDGVAIHPYAANPASVLARVRAARQTLGSLGLGAVPLYVTEFGWTTRPVPTPNFAPARLRPAYIARTVPALAHSACGVAAVLLYTWLTPERDPRNPEDWFGIEPPGGGSSPDMAAFARGLRAAEQPSPRPGSC